MCNHAFTKYAVITKYGFVRDVFEDYQYEGDLENIDFTDLIQYAKLVNSKETNPPKYARGVHWEDSIENWAKAIGGELVEVKVLQKDYDRVQIVDGIKSYRKESSKEYLYPVQVLEEQGFVEYVYEKE